MKTSKWHGMGFADPRSQRVLFARLLLAVGWSVSLVGGSAFSDTVAEPSLGEVLTRLAVSHGVCAVAVAVVRAGKLDRTETASGCQMAFPLAPDAIFQAASLSKPVFARAVLKMATQGKIDLDAPIVNYLPQGYFHRPYPFLPDFAAKSTMVDDPRLAFVTARMVLNHSSGLPNWSDGPLHFDFLPGGGWQYSGEGYVLLQRAMEAITQTPLDTMMEKTTLRPLAMSHSSYIWRESFEAGFQKGKNGRGETWKFAEAVAPATLYTSAPDYGRFLASVVSDRALMKVILSNPVPVDADLGIEWGLGWGIERTAKDTYIFQWGNNPGYRAFAISSVTTGDGLIVLTNSEDGMALADPLPKIILPGEHQVFKFRLLREGVMASFCGVVRVCP